MERTVDEIRAARNRARREYKRVCREQGLDSRERGRAWLAFLELDEEFHQLKRNEKGEA